MYVVAKSGMYVLNQVNLLKIVGLEFYSIMAEFTQF